MAGQARTWAHSTQQRDTVRQIQCVVLQHLCGSDRLLCHFEALFPEDISLPSWSRYYPWTPTLARRPSFVWRSVGPWLKDVMHYFWIYSVWIPGVAFLFGFQGKNLLFHSFILSLPGRVYYRVQCMCSNAVWRSLESLGIVWGRADCLLVPVVLHQLLLIMPGAVSAHLGGCICVSCVFEMSKCPVWSKSARWRLTHLQT